VGCRKEHNRHQVDEHYQKGEMMRKKRVYKNAQPDYLTHEDLIKKLGYKQKESDRGLSVTEIRVNGRGETVLSVASAKDYDISWLEKQLNKFFKIRKKKKDET
jgi:hypothetical protein